jgi:hypothetical protein
MESDRLPRQARDKRNETSHFKTYGVPAGTLFKLGSHRLNVGPPHEWNRVPDETDPLPGGRSTAGGVFSCCVLVPSLSWPITTVCVVGNLPLNSSGVSAGGAVGKAMTPYAGPECHTVECPAGSVILYDARTWHR